MAVRTWLALPRWQADPAEMIDDVDHALQGSLPLYKIDCTWNTVFTTEDIEKKLREVAKEV